MKKGMLITNGFVGEESFKSLFRALMEAAEKENIAIEQQSNDSLLFDIASGEPLFDIDRYSFGIFWDKDIMLGQMLEKCGLRLFNSARAVALCDDKGADPCGALRQAADAQDGAGAPDVQIRRLRRDGLFEKGGGISRPAADNQGMPRLLRQAGISCGYGGTGGGNNTLPRGHAMIMQQAVRESFGRDVRIYVVGGEVMGAMRRSNDRDFRANIANGGSAEAYVPSDEEKHLALEAVRLLGLDFGGVDILHSQEGPLLCEVNSNAHFAGMEKSTGADISGAVMRYIRSELEK